jgi:hypothetical protein
VEIFAEGLADGSESMRRAKAQHIFSTMVGGLTFARAMSDPRARDEFLAQLRSSVLRELTPRYSRASEPPPR